MVTCYKLSDVIGQSHSSLWQYVFICLARCGGGNSTTAEEVSRFQRLFPNPSWLVNSSWLVWGRASRHQKLAPTFPWIDNCLMVTKRDFLKMEASLWLNVKSRVSLKDFCLPYAVGKQRFIPLINLGKKWTLSWYDDVDDDGIELFLFLCQYSKEENSKQNREESCNKNSHNELGNLDFTIRFRTTILHLFVTVNHFLIYLIIIIIIIVIIIILSAILDRQITSSSPCCRQAGAAASVPIICDGGHASAATLVGCGRPGELQDWPPCLQMSLWYGARLPVRSVHSGFNFRWSRQHALILEVGLTTPHVKKNKDDQPTRVLLRLVCCVEFAPGRLAWSRTLAILLQNKLKSLFFQLINFCFLFLYFIIWNFFHWACQRDAP